MSQTGAPAPARPDEIVIDGQLDHQRYQVPAATHELFQEKQFDYQYSGILSS